MPNIPIIYVNVQTRIGETSHASACADVFLRCVIGPLEMQPKQF